MTRFWPGAEDSLIDHCWVNCGDRIIAVKNTVRAVGDHNLLEIQIRVKGSVDTEQNVVKRNWKLMDMERFKLSAAENRNGRSCIPLETLT